MLKAKDISKMIDHTVLRPFQTDKDLETVAAEAIKYDVKALCVRPDLVKQTANLLKGSDVLPIVVIGYPHGSNLPEVKAFEARKAVDDGAKELDMVLSIGKLLSGDYDYVKKGIEGVVKVGKDAGIITKVIFENCYLTPELIEKACHICVAAGADFVKTSTGFGTSHATLKDVQLMVKACGGKAQVKAAGAVPNLDYVLAYRKIGATRIGTMLAKVICEEALKREADGTLKEATDAQVAELLKQQSTPQAY